MKVAIVQHDILWGRPTENLARLSLLLDHQSGADLYVLTETFATGFLAERKEEGERKKEEEVEGLPLEWLQSQAREKNAAFAASIAVSNNDSRCEVRDSRYEVRGARCEVRGARCEDSFANRLFFVRPDGSYDYYDKRHLFGYAGETKAYVPGDRRVVVEWRGVRFLLQVCYDLRFPVWSRNCHYSSQFIVHSSSTSEAAEPSAQFIVHSSQSSRQDYDAAIYVANWPASRIDVWQTLLKARALENQCFVIGVNRVGNDPACHYCGGSVVIDAYGKTIAACPDNEESVAVATLDMERLRTFRQKFPVLDDGDDFTVHSSQFTVHSS